MTIEQRVKELNDKAVRELVDAHKERVDEPLVLAVRFDCEDSDIHLLEVLRGFPGDDDDELLVTEFEQSAQLRILGKLQLVLGSPAQILSGLHRSDALLLKVKGGVTLFEDSSQETRDLKRLLGL